MPEDRGIQDWLTRGWHGGSTLAWLAPLAALFALYVALRRLAYRKGLLASRDAGVPVVVIGNITAGGTGKTPLVIWLASQLRARGIAAGVVLRGHGGHAAGVTLVHGDSDPADVGDEAVVIARRTGCPVAVGRRRVEAAQLLAAQGCAMVISDDGLQHLALRRDLEIAVVDGQRGLGNGALLPQGPLRETPRRLLAVDAVVVNGADAAGIAARLKSPLSMRMQVDALRSVRTDEEAPVGVLRDALVHAVAGIGNPQRFFAQLRELGCRLVEHPFPDHHPFMARDLAFAEQLPVVMTEKDAVKCRAFATDRMQYLQVSATLPEADAARLLQLVQGSLRDGERFHA